MYQVYKLVRMINATYPNNGFIDALDVDVKTKIGEDLVDVINEALHETYKEVELDEVYSFQTIPGQAEYSLPEDCDMSQIQEVTRSFGVSPLRFGDIKPIEEIVGDSSTRPPVEGSDNDYSDMPDGWEDSTGDSSDSDTGIPNPDNDEVILPWSMTNESNEEESVNYYDGGLYSEEHYKKLPEGVGVHYYGHVNKFNPNIGNSIRLAFARDAECLTGHRYYNAWESKRIGIHPVPRTRGEVITIYYKKKPKDILNMEDDLEIKDKYISILKYNVCAKLAMMGNNPDIDMYNIFTRQYNDLLLEARREKDSDLPFYPHTKDNERPSTYYRRRVGRFRR